jgi:endonuclease/exonuclease/phosphatase family metal-dependent hydrolase
MWVKLILLLLFCLMILGAVHFAALPHESEQSDSSAMNVHSLRLLTWNIGYAELEDDTRAHDKDLPAVADVILHEDPDAVALQELTGNAQLKSLLGLLHGKYRGSIAQQGKEDRYEAVLVKDNNATFTPIPLGGRYALAASFRARADAPEVMLFSAHADAFNAARRRTYTEALIDWARSRAESSEVFVAGDFNFELNARNETNIYTDNLKHDSESYSYILRYFRDLGRNAGDTAINDRRIDYVFGPAKLNTLDESRFCVTPQSVVWTTGRC